MYLKLTKNFSTLSTPPYQVFRQIQVHSSHLLQNSKWSANSRSHRTSHLPPSRRQQAPGSGPSTRHLVLAAVVVPKKPSCSPSTTSHPAVAQLTSTASGYATARRR